MFFRAWIMALVWVGQGSAWVSPHNGRSMTPRSQLGASSPQQETTATTAAATTATKNPRKHGLALLLDEGTRQSHSVAQNSAFVTGFFRGLSTRRAYRQLLTAYYFVYREMEQALDACTDERVQRLDYPQLRRLPALERDMAYFYGPAWSRDDMSPATRVYVEHIQRLVASANDDDDASTAYLLIAHQYTRYLGDLFGGQMMSGMAQKSLNLDADKGVDFYAFDDIEGSVSDFITDWYTTLNQLVADDLLSAAQQQAIVDEANLVFELNIGILEELEGNMFLAMWSMAVSSLKEQFFAAAK